MRGLSEHIISQALSREPGTAARAFIAGRQRKLERKAEKRADLLARPDLLQKRVADHAQILSLSTGKLRTRKYGTKLEALEAQSRGTPQEGFASELLAEYTAALEDPRYLEVSERQLLAGVTQNLMFRPDEEGKSRLQKGYRYKWRADTSLGNLFGIFGEDKGVRKLPGYEKWLEEEKTKPVEEWHTGPAEAAAWGGGFTVALMGASKILGRAAMVTPAPGARIVGGALMAIPEFMAFDAVHNVLAKTEWGRAREGTWRKLGVDMLAGGVIIGAGHKTAAVAIRKAAEKSVLSKGVTELLMKHPTAARAIEAGRAQKAARVAQEKADASIIMNISREDVLNKVGDLSTVLTRVGEKKAREEGLTGLARTLKKIERVKAKEEIVEMTKGLELAGVRGAEAKAEVGAMVRGLRTAAARPMERARAEAAIIEEGRELVTEVRAVSKTVDELLNKVQEAAGIKKVSRKKAAKIFTKELNDEGVEAATKKAGKTGKMKEAVVEQQRVQQLAKEQVGREAKPALISSSSKGSQLYLEFDNRLGVVPNVRTIKDYAEKSGFSVNVIKYEDSLISAVRDTTRYRIDVWEGSRLSSKAAAKLSKEFGGEFKGPSVKLLGKVSPEKSKSIISAERAKTVKKKKIEKDVSKTITTPVSKVAPKVVTEIEKSKFIRGTATELSKDELLVFKDATGKQYSVAATSYEEAFEKVGMKIGWDGVGEVSAHSELSNVRFFEGIPQSPMVEQALLFMKNKMPKVWKTVKKVQVIPGNVLKEGKAGYFREDTKTLSIIYDPKHVTLRGYINTIAHELGHAFEGRHGIIKKGEGVFAEKLGRSAMKIFDEAASKIERTKAIKERAEMLRKTGVIKEVIPSEEAAIKKEFEHISLEEAGLVEVFEGGVEESLGGFKKDTTKDLIDLFGDAKKLFGIGAAAIVGAALGAREAEASPGTLIKMGLKAGKKAVKPLTKEYRMIGGIKAPKEVEAFKLADELGLRFEAYAKPEEGVAGAGYMFSMTEKAHPLWRGKETSFSVERLKDLPAKIKAVSALWKVGAVIGSVALTDLFTPDSAEANILKPLGVTVPKIAASVIKGTKGKMLKLAGDMKDAGFLYIPITKESKEVLYFQDTISTAKVAVEKHRNLIRNIKADVSPFGKWLTKRLSPYTTGDILYDISPMPEVGNLQSVIGNNVMNSITAVGNVLRDVPGLLKRTTSGVIEKAMAPLAKRYSTDVAAFRAVTTELEKLEKPYAKLYKALSKEGGEQHIPALEKMEARRASLLTARDELGPIFAQYTKDWEVTVKELAVKHPTTRVALACEDTADYVKYPWLEAMMKPEEKEAVIWLKDLNQSYGIRMAEAGHDVIEGPYCHHALHPEWIEKRVVERLSEFGLDSKALPFSKFFHRAKYSRMMMPDINYTMQKYLIDAERRIQWSKFWGKGQKNSWYAHKRWVDTFGTEDQKMFWKRLTDSAVPPAQTKGNVLANIYSSFEVARLLAFSPSVALKHYFKNIGTMSVMGVGNFASHLPEAIITSVKGAKNSPEMKTIYKLLGAKGTKGKRKVFDEVADSFITQIHRMNMVADLDFEAMIPNKSGFWKAVTEKLQGFNRWGSIPVRAIESVDRHHTVLAAWEAAAKKGMTAQQAIYGIYGNILKLNFLSGAANPAWVRNPKIRSILLFQNTAFKIMERRLMTAWKAGKDVKTAIGVIRHQDIGKTLKEMGEIGKYVLGAERELKQNMIFDALTGSKDFFGSSAIKQAMTEAIISGALLGGGGIIGMNLMPQVFHLPLLAHGAKAPTIAVNPFLNAMFRVAGEREKAEEYGIEKDFMLTAFTKSWLKGSGYVNQTANKMIRISKHDIPEIYKGSKWQYFFSVPGVERY